MIGDLPVVTFDTSAHNRLVDDGPLSEVVLAGIKSGIFFRFAGLSIEELVSTSDPVKRAALFNYCARLQAGVTDCLYPQNELIRLLVVEHYRNPSIFNWTAVDVRGHEYEDAISRRYFVGDEELARAQLQELKSRQKRYKQMFSTLRPELQKVFDAHREARPTSLRDTLSRLQSGESHLIWGIGKLLYDRGAETDASEATVKQFIDVCPPFRALIYAMLMSWYDLSVRNAHLGEKFKAGGNDLFMSIYLPYCDQFVTAEKKGEQEKCLREVASLVNLETKIVSYDDFCTSFLVRTS
jgi:hypothetical protein